jgi:phosphoribosylaminoimidazolecarboxamide formyltransferase/IMP cyclohydrolase
VPAALLSVTDKTGLVPFARGLAELGYTLLSTGGTAKLLRESGLSTTDVADYTASPEILDGRVKTLHPKIHGAILHDRNNPGHVAEAERQGIGAIDLVVVNLYRFKEEALARRLTPEAAIEHIDIGGPTMLRAAAKNWMHCLPVIDPADYGAVLTALRQGRPERGFRQRLAAKVFRSVSAYDDMIASFLEERPAADGDLLLPEGGLALERVAALRYGENPHQRAALYAPAGRRTGFAAAACLQGKELSYNNILDLDAATALASDLASPAVVIIKHTNPCGVATGERPLGALFQQALACDPKSAFGGIVAFNRKVDRKAAEAAVGLFLECVAAPAFDDEALAVFKAKPNLRVVHAPFAASGAGGEKTLSLRSVRGGYLVQDADTALAEATSWKVVTKATPTPAQSLDLVFAMTVAKHVKSNAIVFAREGISVGVGAGQMSRVDSAQIAVAKAAEAGKPLAGAVLASDAFFPFRDTVEFAARHGVAAIVQPGGSIRDQESIEAADAAKIAMVFTGMRHFRH